MAVEQDFDRFCMAALGDAEGSAKLAVALGWREYLRSGKGRYHLQPGLEGTNSAGPRALYLYEQGDGEVHCSVSSRAADTTAVAQLLAARLASRWRIQSALPNSSLVSCASFEADGSKFEACNNEYIDAPRTASLGVTARPETAS
jgi:hypothetical protein